MALDEDRPLERFELFDLALDDDRLLVRLELLDLRPESPEREDELARAIWVSLLARFADVLGGGVPTALASNALAWPATRVARRYAEGVARTW
ncbi:MAG TPA: hypothetical protein VK510_21095 [Solirubrobacteraceae bacterium]|nr:hypothetical protein [Solirubrobacteraceae bacterium]